MLHWPIGPPQSQYRKSGQSSSAAAAVDNFYQDAILARAAKNPGKLDMLVKTIQTLHCFDSNCDAVLLPRMG